MQGNQEAKPRGQAAGCRVGKEKQVRQPSQTLVQEREVVLSCNREIVKLSHLSQTYGCLHVCHLEIVSQMRVHVLVVIATRKTGPLDICLLYTSDAADE